MGCTWRLPPKYNLYGNIPSLQQYLSHTLPNPLLSNCTSLPHLSRTNPQSLYVERHSWNMHSTDALSFRRVYPQQQWSGRLNGGFAHKSSSWSVHPRKPRISTLLQNVKQDLECNKSKYRALGATSWISKERDTDNDNLWVFYFSSIKGLKRFTDEKAHRAGWDWHLKTEK
jgi:hypothetical protein